MKGKIVAISGPTVTVDLPGLKLYDRVLIGNAGLQGEVVRLAKASAIVQVYEETRGLGVGEPAEGLQTPLTVKVGPGLLGSIFDGLQRPLEKIHAETGPFIGAGSIHPPLDPIKEWHFEPAINTGQQVAAGDVIGTVQEGRLHHQIVSPSSGTVTHITDRSFHIDQPLAMLDNETPLYAWQKRPIRTPSSLAAKAYPKEPLVTGQRVIDFLFPIAKGGTAIIPGGFGTGKTILEQAIAKFADVDVVLYVGCGERGNEMAELLEEFARLMDPWTQAPLLERTVMVANTSNMPVAAREASIYTAVTMAEYFRDQGCQVLLLADSISRWAEALREISSALEEMPGEEGYPTYLASRLATYFSRAGVLELSPERSGSLSMILSVSPAGGDFTEPATQACLRTTGVFLMLDTALAHRRHFPAINWFQSFSLYEAETTPFFNARIDPNWAELRKSCRTLLQREEQLREVAEIVGAEGLQDCDHLVMLIAEKIRKQFLCQNSYTDDAFSPPEQTIKQLSAIMAAYEQARGKIEAGITLDELMQELTT